MFGFVSQTRAVKRRLQTLAMLNLELAKVEGKQKATSLGIAGGLAIAAAVLAVSVDLPVGLSLLIDTAFILLVSALVGFLGVLLGRPPAPPKPELALEEAERTVGTLQSHV